MLNWCRKNLIQAILIVWMFFYAMMGVHELGHILAAWMTGVTVTSVVWSPWSISRTDIQPNPSPLVVAWAGPIFGAILPVVIDLMLQLIIRKLLPLSGSFAAFCLLTNGLYIGIGSFDHVGDCRELLANGAQLWHLWAFGLFFTTAGIWRLHQVDLAWGKAAPEKAD